MDVSAAVRLRPASGPLPSSRDSSSSSISTTEGHPPRRSRWARLLLLSFTLLAEGIHGLIANGLFPAIRNSLALPLSALGMLQALPQLAGALCGPALNVLAQRTDRKTVLVFCAVGGGAGVMAAGWAANLSQLVVLYTLGGICFSGSAPIVNGLLTDLFPSAERGRALGSLYCVLALTTAALGPVIGLLSNIHDGWRYGFFAAGAACGLAGLLVALFVRDPGVGASEPELAEFSKDARDRYARIGWAEVQNLFGIRTFTCSVMVALLDKGGLLSGIAVVCLVDIYGFDNGSATLVALPAGVGGIIGAIAAGSFVDRVLSGIGITRTVFFVQTLMLLNWLLVFLCTQVRWGSIVMFSCFFFLYGLTLGASAVVGRPILLAIVLPEQLSTAIAIQASVAALTGAGMSWVMSKLAELVGLKMAMLTSMTVPTACAIILFTIMYRTIPEDSKNRRDELQRRTSRIGARGPGQKVCVLSGLSSQA